MKMAEKLKLARKNAKLTQEEVSQVFGIKRASVSLWESSQPKSTKPNIRKLAKPNATKEIVEEIKKIIEFN